MLKIPVSAAAVLLACILSVTAQPAVPGFDAARVTFGHDGEMDFDDGPGSLSISRFELRSVLSKPISPAEGLTILPFFGYEATALDFDDTTAGFPIGDEDLHSLSLSAFAVSMREGSPWVYGGWAQAELATDFQDVGEDDFTFDLGGGVGYRFNEKFTLGLGAVVLNLNGDSRVYPGISFDWMVNDQVRVGLYGPTLIAAYSLDENWLFSLRGEPGGGVWNIRDDDGQSHSIDLSSYRLGAYASRRLSENLWLTAGAGATVGNDIRLTEPNGDRLSKQEMDAGLFGQIALRMKAW